MQINKLILKNYKLFKNAEINFDKINIICGENGVGKSTILKGIIYGYYGEGCGNILLDLISFGEKFTEVKLESNQFSVIRKIPTILQIFQDNKEIQFNTSTLKQNWINEQIGNYDFFKKYRLFTKQSINLLDLGITSLRKELMTFIDDKFAEKRESLLAKKLERETYNVNKRLYSFNLSDKRLLILEMGLRKLQEELNIAKKDCDEQYKIIGNYKSEVDSRKKIIYFKEQDKKKLNGGNCPILNVKCSQISGQLEKVNIIKNKEIGTINQEIEEIDNLLQSEEDYMNHYNKIYESIQGKIQRTKDYLMKLREAQKFSNYKYTLKDVQLYTDSIKTWDSFSGWYIQTWLDNLTCIINDLLKPINIIISFSADKQFLLITEDNREMKYENLSDGQQVFLNIVFKIGILLNNGINNGIVIIDDSINLLMMENIKKLIEVLKQTPFQIFLVKQDIVKGILDVNYIDIIRKEGESKINE
jgi:ABC-type dipeptide/oligopeptide/nickel transport system ATPase subunit